MLVRKFDKAIEGLERGYSTFSGLASLCLCRGSSGYGEVWKPCVRGGRFRGGLFGARVCLVTLVRRTTHEADRRNQMNQLHATSRGMRPFPFPFMQRPTV